MDQNNFFADDNISKKPATGKIDDFANLKGNTMDFLSHERSEKFDEEKPKVDVDDFLNFHDNFDEAKPQPQPQESPFSIPNIEKIVEPIAVTHSEPEPEIDFHAIDDDFLNTFKGNETNKEKEKFISSEDLMSDFKDPVTVSAPIEIPAPAPPREAAPAPPREPTPPKEVAPAPPKEVVPEKPPVTEPIKPVVEPSKPTTSPPPAPVKQKTSDDTQIEAEKIFKSIGLG